MTNLAEPVVKDKAIALVGSIMGYGQTCVDRPWQFCICWDGDSRETFGERERVILPHPPLSKPSWFNLKAKNQADR